MNYHTPKQLSSVQYNDLDCAVQNSLKFLKATGATQLYYAKSDCSNAFRILPGRISQRWLLILKMRHPKTSQWCYFVDKCMPFGASISCANFQAFSDALKHITEWHLELIFQIHYPITNYLDDFLFFALTLIRCNQLVKIFLEICRTIGCPISMEKTEWASQLMIFLGILLNGQSLTLSIPLEKKQKANDLLDQAINQKKVTVKFIQKLTGTLNFLNKAIIPGCTFTRGMYQKLTLTDKAGRKLKAHHHVYLNQSFLLDCIMWNQFLKVQSDDKMLCRPFIDFYEDQNFEILTFYSDSLLNANLGMGAIFNGLWMQGFWTPGFV